MGAIDVLVTVDDPGCRFAEGRSWCDLQQFGGGPRGFVAAEFPSPAISPEGSAASGVDDSALLPVSSVSNRLCCLQAFQ